LTAGNAQLLADINVIDLTRVLAGPYCTMMLGDLGADVIKIEAPDRGDDTRHWGPPFTESGESAYFLCVNRNKRSLTLNLKTDKGLRILKDLIKQADVLIENFKAGTLEQWGLSYSELTELHPSIIYCTITGYGYSGPYRNRPGYDFIIQAQGGIMSITGPAEGEPYKVGVAITDITAGHNAAIAILAALYARERTGKGQRIDISLLDSQVAWLANVASNYLISGQSPARYGNAHANIVPYQVFTARDRPFAFAVGNDRQWQAFCEAVEHAEWAQDERFHTNAARVEHRTELVGLLTALFSSREMEEWLALAQDLGVPAAPINTVDQVFEDPQVQARQMRIEIEHPRDGPLAFVGSPLKIADAPPQIRYPPPLLGQHSTEILTEALSFSSSDLLALEKEGVI